MPDALRTFSDDDLGLLRDLIRDKREGRLNTPYRARFTDSMSDLESPQSPEVYIAYPQDSDGIPALTAGTGGNPDIAGKGICDIYRILKNGTNQPEIIAVTGLEQEVFNLSSKPLAQDWIVVHRDKFGYWLTSPPGAGGSRIRAEILSVDCTTSPISAVCLVLSRPCGVATVEGEDENGQVTVYDRLGCVLNEPEGDLIGRQLKADYLDSGYFGTGTEYAGTGSTDQPCQWEVDFLCCGDNDCNG